MRRQVNDALIAPFAGLQYISRVITLTETGRCVVDVFGDGKSIKIEDKPGDWEKCGYFSQHTTPFGRISWTFHPIEKVAM